MKADDDTKMPTGAIVAELAPGHALARLDDGRLAHVVEPDHARAKHPELAETGTMVALRRPRAAPARSGPAQVATEAYREGYDRIFGRRPAGEA